MALENGHGTVTKEQQKKVYATDEAGMMKDAKEYAKRDFTVVLATFNKMYGKEGTEEQKEQLANALIQVKYEQIVEARTNRVSYFD